MIIEDRYFSGMKVKCIFMICSLVWTLSTDAMADRSVNACKLAMTGYWEEFSLRTCEKNARAGDVFSQFLFARILLSDKVGDRDVDRSIYFYSLAANNRMMNAIITLGAIYHRGSLVEKNLERAYMLYAVADFLGHEKAHVVMSTILQHGVKDTAEKQRIISLAQQHIERLRTDETAIIPWRLTPGEGDV